MSKVVVKREESKMPSGSGKLMCNDVLVIKKTLIATNPPFNSNGVLFPVPVNPNAFIQLKPTACICLLSYLL